VRDARFDFYSHDPAASAALVEHVLDSVPGPLTCHVAKSDEWKQAIVAALGFLPEGTEQVEAPGGQRIEFDVFALAAE